MKESDLIQLLEQNESETLDFKRQQYPFVGTSEEVKGELLKDIIAMANVRKDSPRYILIGVDEKLEPANRACGADASLRDSDVQQFVNAKVNRPISFLVETISYKGVSVTVIRIDNVQKPPIFLKQSFGRVKSNVVYVRRGSSTEELNPDILLELAREERHNEKELAKQEAASRFWRRFSTFLPQFDNRIVLLKSRTSSQAFENVHESRLPLRELLSFLEEADNLKLDDGLFDLLGRAVTATEGIEDYIHKGAEHINDYKTNFRYKIEGLQELVSELIKKYGKS